MDLQPNKSDAILKPITNTRISASEWNQLVGSCMAFIYAAGFSPDAADNEQFLNAFKKIASELELVGANTALSNLTDEGANIGNWSSNISNCITNIPQDIKLELNNGTLTLKAGSKVYVPNGFEQDGTTPKFDEVIIENDIPITNSYAYSGKVFIIIYGNGTGLQTERSEIVSSGSTPGYHDTYGLWYDTTENIIKRTTDGGTTWSGNWALPIAVCNFNNNITSIDKVFNGFGYVGSTVFAFPGVKCLIPNGRNADGSLKSIKQTISSVKILNVGDRDRKDVVVFINGDGLLDWARSFGNVASFPTRPQVAPMIYTRAYIEDENVWIHCYDTTTWQTRDASDNIAELFSVDTDANAISGIYSMGNIFHALDYNKRETISGWSMPSNSYIDLTIGADGTQYTAPANGYVNFRCLAGTMLQLYNLTAGSLFASVQVPNSSALGIWLPVKKGDIFSIYSVVTTPWRLRFHYAEGSKSEAN